MKHGTSLVWGRPTDLAKQYWPTPQVQISALAGTDLDPLADRDDVVSFDRNATTATLGVADLAVVPDLVADLAARGVRVTGVVPFNPTLEDLYFAVRRSVGSTDDEIPPPPSTTGRPSRRSRVAQMAR